MISTNYQNKIFIQENSKIQFQIKVEELLLSPPEWVAKHVQAVRKLIDGVPSDLTDNYSYSPGYVCPGIDVKLDCTKNCFKLSLSQEDPIEPVLQLLQKNHSDKEPVITSIKEEVHDSNAVRYQGPLTSDSVSLFPSHLQEHASKLAKQDFPYTATITDNVTTVGGSMHFVGKTMTLADLLKEYGNK